MKTKKLLISENCFRLLFESDDSYMIDNFKRLIESGQKEDIELAFQLGEGMESYIPNFNLEQFIENEYGDLTRMFPDMWIKEALEKLFGSPTFTLNNSKLTELPTAFTRLVQVDEIFLTSCELLQRLPNDIHKLTMLGHLSLRSSKSLSEVPNDFYKLNRLQYLNLTNCNSLTSLPDTFAKLPNLQGLNLTDCTSLFLPNNFHELKSLKKLDLKGTQMTIRQKNVLRKLMPNCTIN